MILIFIHVHACSEGLTFIPAVELVRHPGSLWKSLIERQMRLLISKRPVGVNSLIRHVATGQKMRRCAGCDPRNLMDGGFMGKSSGNSRMPQLSKFFRHPHARFTRFAPPNSPRHHDTCLKK